MVFRNCLGYILVTLPKIHLFNHLFIYLFHLGLKVYLSLYKLLKMRRKGKKESTIDTSCYIKLYDIYQPDRKKKWSGF